MDGEPHVALTAAEDAAAVLERIDVRLVASNMIDVSDVAEEPVLTPKSGIAGAAVSTCDKSCSSTPSTSFLFLRLIAKSILTVSTKEKKSYGQL